MPNPMTPNLSVIAPAPRIRPGAKVPSLADYSAKNGYKLLLITNNTTKRVVFSASAHGHPQGSWLIEDTETSSLLENPSPSSRFPSPHWFTREQAKAAFDARVVELLLLGASVEGRL